MSWPMKYIKSNASFIIKLTIFLALLTVFLVSNFKPQLDKYLEGSTTFSSRIEKIYEYEAPLIIMCANPGTKPSLSKKYGYHLLPNSIFYDNTNIYTKFNLTLWQMYLKLTYSLETDIEISFDLNRQGNFVKLNKGLNTIGTNQIEVFSICKHYIVLRYIFATNATGASVRTAVKPISSLN